MLATGQYERKLRTDVIIESKQVMRVEVCYRSIESSCDNRISLK